MNRRLIAQMNRLARILYIWGSPATGAEAYLFWEKLSSSNWLTLDIAQKLYIKAGYHPFTGYPLTRTLSRWSRNS